ncbi:MAG TPA: pectate lyase [Chitinophagaceae bacterium]
MKKIWLVIRNCCIFSLIGCAQQNKTASIVTDDQVIAFPGAEGFGKYTTGGRGGKVFIVTNLDDDGPGSFRTAVSAKDKRIVVFAVSGTIHLASPLKIRSDITIAGQSAPGDGICLADYPVTIHGDNIIVRFIRFRMGDKNQKGGMVDGNGGDDAFGGTHCKNIIIDHCSMSWSTDEVFSVYGGDSTTLQWNLIAEPLNYSYHFETGDSDYEHHGYGAIWGGRHSSFHHNLFAHCANRTPRFDGIRNIPSENCDYRNNVIYNWASSNIYAGEGGNYNMVNNYYKYGPSTNVNAKGRILIPYKKPPSIPFGKFYLNGNYIDGSTAITTHNELGVIMNNGTTEDKIAALVTTEFPAEYVKTQSAEEAYVLVTKNAGAILPVRDTLDERIINDVRNRKGRFIDVQGGYPHGTAFELTVNAWPALKSLPAPADNDKDGMPDDWEVKHGLNPADAADASQYKLDKHYTNIEVYLNSLVKLK